MRKDGDDPSEITINSYCMYGYFRADGSLYKIYQPHVVDRKFIKVKSYIQGSDQLEYKHSLLVITSSMKDMLCLINTKWSLESVAPDSENSMIPEHMIEAYKHKYKKIITLFDNDDAGITAMKKYRELYDIPYVLLEGEKDLSDNIKKSGRKAVEAELFDLIKKKLKPTQELA